jgi:tetratricopeptide (TPR) repeat protein
MSDLEIPRLIDLLAKTSELGVLSKLNREMQFAAIKEKHGKELLVTLREVTEGKSFDAILEDEYRGIRPAIARDLYMAVSCFHQHGAHVRDNALSKILDVSLSDLYERTSDSTEGVIMYEDVDKSRGAYAARTRHRTIAKVVWERCGSPEEWDRLLTRSLAALNLNYGLDKRAFEDFVRSDYSIDQIRTLDGKIKFFETAAKKDPESPYVKQHYARMLLRQGKPELALGQIDQAIELSSRARVLHHTRGTILMSLAFSAGSPELARRRLSQSEASFRTALSLYERDEYSYQGLVQLYRRWAEHAPTPEESADYIAKAEETVTEGLKQVRVRSSLWIESSKIQAYLGHQPSRLEALEQAVHESPGSIIARYLLGRAYRFEGRFDDALAILKPVIQSHHEEFRAFVEYALVLAIIQQTYDESIPTLQLSTLYGFSDPRFIATLGGMQIMTGQITEGNKVFEESIRRNFTSDEMNKIQFRPWDLSNHPAPLKLDGVVIVRKAGYALIESEGFPPFLIPGWRIGELAMEKGLKVSFEPAFAARGRLAVNPKSI